MEAGVSLLATIREARGGEVIGALARRAGLDESGTERAMRALVPEIGRALRSTSESRTGAPAMHAITQNGRYERYLEEPAALDEPQAMEQGEALLRDLFGSHEDAREVAEAVARASALDAGAVERLQPLVAVLAVGALSREVRATTPTVPGHFGTRPEDVGGAPLARALAHLFGEDRDRTS